jgi:hypothetical protein
VRFHNHARKSERERESERDACTISWRTENWNNLIKIRIWQLTHFTNIFNNS